MEQKFFVACKAIIVQDNKMLLLRDSGGKRYARINRRCRVTYFSNPRDF
ncbi:MAG: hypothetical protein HYV41_02095 [Candidatus Magasanikbacteria bacterium]|nr:hypothetical protein [Candidatus Magasanikbacteria bacterium]